MPAAAIVTLVIVAVLVAAVAVALIWIALVLRQVDDTLGKVTFGVRAIAHRTGPLNDSLGTINTTLDTIAGAIEGLVERLGAREPSARV